MTEAEADCLYTLAKTAIEDVKDPDRFWLQMVGMSYAFTSFGRRRRAEMISMAIATNAPDAP